MIFLRGVKIWTLYSATRTLNALGKNFRFGYLFVLCYFVVLFVTLVYSIVIGYNTHPRGLAEAVTHFVIQVSDENL